MSGEVKQAGAAPRVCFLLDSMAVGGIQTLIITLCRRLLKEGCNVDLIIRLPGSSLMLERIPGGVRTMLLHEAPGRFRAAVHAQRDAGNGLLRRWETRMRRVLHHIGPLLTGTGLHAFRSLYTANRRINHPLSFARTAYFSACSRQVARYIETEKPDVMYSAGETANIVALLGRRAARRKPRLIVSVHSSPMTLLQQSKLALMRHFIAAADAVHTVSRGMEDAAVEEYGLSREKITLVYNPAFHDEIPDLKRQKCDHPWITQKGEEKIILWAGRGTTPKKDLNTLLRAFRILCQRRNVRLILLGFSKRDVGFMSSEVRELCNRLAERILTPGYVRNPCSWMAGADAFVLSSKSGEALPTVLIEALGCGCPVVSTDCEHGPREILGDGRWGRLTPVGDAEALADAIDATLDNPLPAEALLARALDFSEERLMPQFMDLLGLPRKPRPAETGSSPAAA